MQASGRFGYSEGLFACLSGGVALNSKPRGLSTWWAKMPASGAEMHPQLKMRGNGMAAVDMQAMEEVQIPLFFGKIWELKICSRIR